MIALMRVDKNAASEAPQQNEPPAAAPKRDKRKELEAAIEKRKDKTLAGSVGELLDGRGARRIDAALARSDKMSFGIKLKKSAGARQAYAVALSAGDCAQFKTRFAEASTKLGVVACGVLGPQQLGELKQAWAKCGDVLGAVATAKAGQWKGGDGVSDAGLSVATAALSQICRKVDLTAMELKKGSPLAELKKCWVKGTPAQLEKADAAALEKVWRAITPDVGNLRAALEPHAELAAMAPGDARWGSGD